MSGLRVSKNVDSGTHSDYYYDGTTLIAEKRNDCTLTFICNASNEPVGLYYNDSQVCKHSIQCGIAAIKPIIASNIPNFINITIGGLK